MSNLQNNDLIGPLYAEAINDMNKIIESYISCNGEEDILKDKYIAPIISGNRLILSGVRGTGKTMILKTAEAVLKKDLYHKVFEINEWELDESDIKILPVYISYSGFKDDISLESQVELSSEEIKYAKEIFRGYFFMSLLQQILKVIEEMELDKNVDFNLFGLKTRFGIKKQVDNVITTFRRIGFRELVNSKKSGLDIDLKIKPLNMGGAISNEIEQSVKEITLNDMQKTSLFKETITSICNTYKIDKIMLLFDEVHYLKYLQCEFFDVLFGFRNFEKISFSISAYPAFMDYGEYFDVPDDAKELSVSSVLYKPSKVEFENPLIKLVELRLRTYGRVQYDEIISKEALELLILLVNGNPRMLLQSIDFIWRKNNQKKINSSNITQDIIIDMVNDWYIGFRDKQAKRYKTNIKKVEDFSKVITKRLNDYNKRNEVSTTFFLLNDEIFNHFSDTIDLLHYSRIIDKLRIASFGGSNGTMGKMYLLNPMVGWYYGIFSKSQISNLVKYTKESLDKDKKSQFDSLKSFTSNIDEAYNISCPRYKENMCLDAKCKGAYSELWAVCPFYPGMNLEVTTPSYSQVEVEVLNLSSFLNSKLNENGINTLKDILDINISGLKQIHQIGDVRAKNIYYATKEYIDDNL
ncbi:hypothetical protein Z968_12675 [Clostridium novyi A str. 4552]|uniref:Uncharacterized protein n=1 Tax=Clostridium novyi A str. 4552 TaxID=1444289 RepID=A0A0A0HZM8_CLONO|nr:hypothetical protein [Clostridium novyi]KGM92795.1 hypothetical protein Z968_12675 [Clostridium novyi A str. 4552]